MTRDRGLVQLRRTIRPYIGQSVILSGFTIFCLFVGFKFSKSAFLWFPAFPWSLFGVFTVCFSMKYRVLWNVDCVVMRASGGPERSIQFDEIASVKDEVSSTGDVLAQSRPFFRISIYPKHDPKGFVDISLRHFQLGDIQELLSAIRVRRPDLDVPTISVNDTARWRRFHF